MSNQHLVTPANIWKSGLLLVAASLVCSSTLFAQTPRRGKTQRTTPQTQTSTKASENFEQLVTRGDEARMAERLDDAVTLYGQALKLRPTWADGWWYTGAILYEKDHYPQARDAFQNLVSLEPARGQGWAMLGLCQFQTGEYERSVVSLLRGRKLGINDNSELASVVRYHTAVLYIRFGEFEIAFDILREFMRVGNNSPKVIEAFGLTMLRMPFLPKEAPPDKRELILIAGQAGFNMAARQLDQARAAFDLLLARYPNEPNVHYGFGVFLLSQDADAALKEFRRELEISPNHFPSMVQMAFEYLKRDQYNDALPFAEKAVQIAPKMYAARNVLGRLLLELGQVARAITELEEGVRIAPSSPEMHFALARAYTRAGRKEDANREREIFKKLQDENEQSESQKTGNNDNKQANPKP
jgi:tetratricopeptide (TPR) repeat protein